MNKVLPFTLKSPGILRELKTQCGVTKPFSPTTLTPRQSGPLAGLMEADPNQYTCLWDTGATGCAISQKVVDDLGLVPTGQVECFHANGSSMVNTYLINLYLPNKVMFPFVRVSVGVLSGFDLLIGMEIITKGDFSITHANGGTTFSFRVPSVKEIDYVTEHKEEAEVAAKTQKNKEQRERLFGKSKKA